MEQIYKKEGTATFIQAKPIWEAGRADTMNRHLRFCAGVGRLSGCKLKIAAGGFYRLWVNGAFLSFGPARAAEGYARVDEIDLSAFAAPENNIEIECVGYHCRTISTALCPNFFAAELTRGDDVLLATGTDKDFICTLNTQQVEKTARYSFQRHFTEVIDSRQAQGMPAKTEIMATPWPQFLPRTAPLPDLSARYNTQACACGALREDENLPAVTARYSNPITPYWGRYDDNELPYHPALWLQKQRQIRRKTAADLPITLCSGEYAVFDFGEVECGFPLWALSADAESDVVVAYSETAIPNAYIKAYGRRNPIDGDETLCSDADFALPASNLLPVIEHLVPAGFAGETIGFEPGSFRYVMIAVKRGSVTLSRVGLRHYQNPMAGLRTTEIRNAELRAVYDAALRTFAHNAVDLYMDCPSRERAGWLCDSYFTAKTEYWLLGNSRVEDAFLENYRLCRRQEGYPEGVLPMCYPSDCHEVVKYIPQWDMWYILEVCDYLNNRRPDLDKNLFRDSVYGFIQFMEAYENADGLYERLPSWNFVEWSKAQDWAYDVSFPTNFLYAAALDETGKLYGDGALRRRAAEIRETALRLSFDGEVFRDHLVKVDGQYVCPNHVSEACQYYAVLFGAVDVTLDKYARLRALIQNGFAGFGRPGGEFVPVNAFIGFYLRLLTLMQLGEREALVTSMKDFFLPMVKESNTLWEYRDGHGSRDHGFASFAALAVGFAEGST